MSLGLLSPQRSNGNSPALARYVPIQRERVPIQLVPVSVRPTALHLLLNLTVSLPLQPTKVFKQISHTFHGNQGTSYPPVTRKPASQSPYWFTVLQSASLCGPVPHFFRLWVYVTNYLQSSSSVWYQVLCVQLFYTIWSEGALLHQPN